MSRGGPMGRAGFALVEILVVMVIILLVAGAYLGLSRKGENGEPVKSTPAQAMDKAKSVECANNLRQLRSLIQMEVADKGEYPPKLNVESGGGLTHCPVSGQPYTYNPSTGEVHCTTPGHEPL